ncbi:MAG: SpoIID/LytB domain-containing protein [Deinococcota bacterium]|nr:SpoIID/LytB domain-containing protein [Deinococcota bacterium]
MQVTPPQEQLEGQDAATQVIRVGVVATATSIEIGSNDAYTLRNKATGATLLSGSGDRLTVSITGAVVTSHYRLQVACASATARDDWLERAQTAGYATYTEFVPTANCWRLFIGEFAADASFSVRSAFRSEVIANSLAGSDSFWKIVTTGEGSVSYEITRGAESITSSAPVVLEAENGLVLIDGRPYRGVAEVAVNGSGTLAGINELPLEHYLYGVVPRELPPVPFGELEAQKAQAVAARTYALANLGKRRADGYDLLPTTSDQVYGGYAAEHPVSTRAVDETAGIAARYSGGYATTLYHSTSGGFTANNEDVYNSAPIAYLRGLPDAERGRAVERVPSLEVFKRSANPASLRARAEGDHEADWSRYHRWTFTWTADEISRAISAFAGKEVGRVLEINVLGRSDSGRVLRIEYVTENGSFYDFKDRVRWSLQYVNASGTLSPLRSTLVYLEPVTDRQSGEVSGFRAFGGGWGHGVGMSQTGAVGMAERGASFERILTHYYQGISLEKMY